MTRSRTLLLPQQELAELFENGKIPYNRSKKPSYTNKSGDCIKLRSHTLRNPSIFLSAFRDYVRSLNTSNFSDANPPSLPGGTEWWNHLRHCEHILRRERSIYEKILTKQNVRRRVNGHCAEFLAARWMRDMCGAFSNDLSAQV